MVIPRKQNLCNPCLLLGRFLRICIILSLFSPLAISSTDTLRYERQQVLNAASLCKERIEYASAISILKQATLNQDAVIKKFLARLLYLNGESQDAAAVLDTIETNDWFTYLLRGLIYEDLQDTKLAASNYLQSVRAKKNSISLYRLGKIYYHKGRYKKAAHFFSETISYDPSIRLAYYYLADTFAKIGNRSGAYEYLAKAKNFYPANKDIDRKLLLAKKDLGQKFFAELERTIEKTRRAVKLVLYERQKDAPLLKVGIAQGLSQLKFSCGSDFLICDTVKEFKGRANNFYTIRLRNGRLFLCDYVSKKIYAVFKGSVEIKTEGYPLYIFDVVYGKANFWHKQLDRAYRGDFKIITTKNSMTLVNVINIEEYLYGVLPNEIPYSSGFEALKAQAVASRTQALKSIGRHKSDGFDLCADVHCQVYQGLSSENAVTNQAVKETKGEVLMYNHKLIEAFYHANCGGCLAKDTFGENEYLVNKFDSKKRFYSLSPFEQELWFIDGADTFCSHIDNESSFRWQRVYDAEDFLIAFGFKLEELKRILPLEKGDCFHYRAVEIETQKQRLIVKNDLKIRDYFDKLRSSAFKLEIKFSKARKPKMLIFWGAGFGHGSGMCQNGAQGMAKRGYTYQEILRHYYPRAKIQKAY